MVWGLLWFWCTGLIWVLEILLDLHACIVTILMVGSNHHLPFHGKVICCPRVSMGNWMDIVVLWISQNCTWSEFPLPSHGGCWITNKPASGKTKCNFEYGVWCTVWCCFWGAFSIFIKKDTAEWGTGEQELMWENHISCMSTYSDSICQCMCSDH